MQDRKLWEEDRYTDLYLAVMELPQELKSVCTTLLSGRLFSQGSIWSILQMKEGTVKSRLSRTREQLRSAAGDRRRIMAREGKMQEHVAPEVQRNSV